MNPILEFSHVSKTYEESAGGGLTALHDVSFQVVDKRRVAASPSWAEAAAASPPSFIWLPESTFRPTAGSRFWETTCPASRTGNGRC